MRLERTGQEQGGTAGEPESVKRDRAQPGNKEDFIHKRHGRLMSVHSQDAVIGTVVISSFSAIFFYIYHFLFNFGCSSNHIQFQ